MRKKVALPSAFLAGGSLLGWFISIEDAEHENIWGMRFCYGLVSLLVAFTVWKIFYLGDDFWDGGHSG